jgi:hypothetical protein
MTPLLTGGTGSDPGATESNGPVACPVEGRASGRDYQPVAAMIGPFSFAPAMEPSFGASP